MNASDTTETTVLLEALSANAASFAAAEGIPFDPVRELDRCVESGIQALQLGMSGYPEILASVSDAPKILYVRGRLTAAGALALVGSRRPTGYGLRMAKMLSAEAARSGIVTVSGMARGIDTAVHQSTLDAGGVTWAVLGSGLERIYPPENARLAERIVVQGGALISEAPLDGPPLAANFPRRNRIISGLAWGTVVVEGGEKSGALITARCAAEQGREVFAVPGPADSPLSDGPLRLIRDGAAMIRHWDDILEALPQLAAQVHGQARRRPPEADPLALSNEEQRIMSLIGCGEAHLETLLNESGFGMDQLVGTLLALEIKGQIMSAPGQRYARR